MDIKTLTSELSVSPQIAAADLAAVKAAGFRSVICHRPDSESSDQPLFREIEDAASAQGLVIRHQPIVSGKLSDVDAAAFDALVRELPKPILAYCRTGTRSASLWSLTEATRRSLPDILTATKAAGYDMSGIVRRIANGGRTPTHLADITHEVVIVGGGAAGIAAAASLLARKSDLDIAIIDPADTHYYQPGWTMVGAGIFDAATTVHTMASVVPRGTRWIKAAVDRVRAQGQCRHPRRLPCRSLQALIVSPGLKLNWNKVEGLSRRSAAMASPPTIALISRPIPGSSCAR